MTRQVPKLGDTVRIDWGKHRDKCGRLIRFDCVQSGQLQVYPVVRLSDGMIVRVRSVTVVQEA